MNIWELPRRLNDELLGKLRWKETGHYDIVVCELGLLRRPSSSKTPGLLSYAPPNKQYPPRFRITIPETKQKIVVDVEDMMKQVFGKFRNKNLLRYDYLDKIRLLCMEYNRRLTMREREEKLALKPVAETPFNKKRKCAGIKGSSCGAMTHNYRCAACWVAIRGGMCNEEDPVSY